MPPKTRSLPKKRSPAVQDSPTISPPSTKKSKAELRRQSLSRAKEWATDRKRKKDGDDEDDVKKPKPDVVAKSEVANEEEAMPDAKLPAIPSAATTRRSARRRVTSRLVPVAMFADNEDDHVSIYATASLNLDDESIGSRTRRSARRRTINASSSKTMTKDAKAPTRRSRRKIVTPTVVEEAPEIEMEEPFVEEFSVFKTEEREIKPDEKIALDKSEAKVEEAVTQEEIAVKIERTEEEEEELMWNETIVKEEEDEVVLKEIVVKEEGEEVVQEETVEKEEEEEVLQEETVVKEEEETIKTQRNTFINEEAISKDEKQAMKLITKARDEAFQYPSTEYNSTTLHERISLIGYLLLFAPVFFHALFVQWTLAFAAMMAFFFDWWIYHVRPPHVGEDILFSQRALCVTLGLWLVTIVSYAIAFGAHSRMGWFLTGLSVAVASFSTTMVAGDESSSVPSLPIYSYSGYEVKMPDVLVVLCFVGFVVVFIQPAALVPEEPLQVAPQMDVATLRAETSEEVLLGVSNGPRLFVGQRVGVEKGISTYLGTIRDYDSGTQKWTVHYDNKLQEEEELDQVQLGSAFKIYLKYLSDNLEGVWRSAES